MLELDPATAELIGEPSYPAHAMKAFEFTGGKELAVYDGTFPIPFRAKLKPGATKIGATLRYQACSDTRLPAAESTPRPTSTSNKTSRAAPPLRRRPPRSFTPLVGGAEGRAGEKVAALERRQRHARLARTAAHAAGDLRPRPGAEPHSLRLSADPDHDRLLQPAERLPAADAASRSPSLYVLGIAITYSALGVFSALSGKLFGAWLQHPAVLIFFALLMLVMASSMFGAFELQRAAVHLATAPAARPASPAR